MPAKKNKVEEIRVYLTVAHKNQLKRMANINQKSLSEYLLNAGLSLTLDSAKMDFYESINSDLINLKKDFYITKKLLLLVGSQQLQSQDKIMDFYRETEVEAIKFFGKD